MGYTTVRILQSFSKLESVTSALDAGVPGLDPQTYDAKPGAYAPASLPVRMSRENIRMTSDIVLMPHGPVTTVFRR